MFQLIEIMNREKIVENKILEYDFYDFKYERSEKKSLRHLSQPFSKFNNSIKKTFRKK